MKQRRRQVVYSIIMSLVFGMLFQFSGFLTKPTYAEETVVRGKGELTTPGVITLDDVQKTLRAALGIIELEGEELWAADLYDNNKITLDNVRIILKAALGIIKISDVIPPSEEPGPVVTEPTESEPAVTDPVVTDPVVTPPVVTDPVVTDPVVTDPVKPDPDLDFLDLACMALEACGVSSDFNLNPKSSYKKDIVKRYAERGITVTTYTFEEMEELGIIFYPGSPAPWIWQSDRNLVTINGIGQTATQFYMEASVYRGGLSGVTYETLLVVRDGKWVVDKNEIIGVS